MGISLNSFPSRVCSDILWQWAAQGLSRTILSGFVLGSAPQLLSAAGTVCPKVTTSSCPALLTLRGTPRALPSFGDREL